MIDKKELLKWLKEVDNKLNRGITIVAVGGTAMTLLSLKPSTIDIDFCVAEKDRVLFEASINNKYKVDIFVDGYIFSEQLPVDYVDKAKPILKLKHITLKALHPVDMVITKAARLNARDEEDIASIAKHVDRNELVKRFEYVVTTYAGR
jgi:predicted nucleotidyltransferase